MTYRVDIRLVWLATVTVACAAAVVAWIIGLSSIQVALIYIGASVLGICIFGYISTLFGAQK